MSKQTIPRLELLSSLLASQLTESVKKAMGQVKSIDSTTYWSDSTVVLSWIRNSNKEYKQFVENRLQKIRKLAPSKLCKYVPTKQNPADIASRGTTATQLVGNKMWWNGPEFLVKSNEHWPSQPCSYQEDVSELKSPQISVTTSTVNATQIPNIMELLDVSKYSSIVRLLRVTAYVLRFVNNLKKRVQHLESTVGSLTHDEINSAEMKLIKDIQYPMTKHANYGKVKVGDVVLIQEDNVKRLNWPIAVIESLLKGKDGNVRAETVRTFNKAGKFTTTRRAVQRLYPVEVGDTEREGEDTSEFPITFVERASAENTG